MNGAVEEAAAPPTCDHHWASRHRHGVSVSICTQCGEPNWAELVQDKYDRDRLWRCLFDAQTQYIDAHEGKAHVGWQMVLASVGAP